MNGLSCILILLPHTLSLATLTLMAFIGSSGVTLSGPMRQIYFLKVGLLGYCNGTENNNTPLVTRCTTPRLSFWFDFAEILIRQSGHVNISMPNDMPGTIEFCHKYTRWSISAFITAFSFTVIVLLIGLTARKSPWGSIFTALCATGAMMSTFAASLTAVLAYATLSRRVNSAAWVIGVKSNIGWSLVGIVSAATLCSLSSTILWFLHVCCCNQGRQSRSVKRTDTDHEYCQKQFSKLLVG
ncbi:actin cortical patch SUR7/pH-response regulator pali [Aspergillus navahoensis]